MNQISKSLQNSLFDLISSEIKNNGGILSFAEFMELALYAPGLGYYDATSEKFGPRGDFVTAPEISPLFSRCLARQTREILMMLQQQGTEGAVLEIGAGTGQMALDTLLELERLGTLPSHYFIIELSNSLKERQEQKFKSFCPHLLERIHWLDAPPFNFNGVILANEVLDAMPIHRFQITETGIQELGVTEKAGHFQLEPFPSKQKAFQALYESRVWPLGYCSEINLNLDFWLKSMADYLENGVILLIDYGFGEEEFYHPDRNTGTLMCHYQHLAHTNPFLHLGQQDITAHVNFTAVATEALAANLEVLGYTNQAAFLLATGLLELGMSYETSEKINFKKNQDIQTLTSPAEMGELFKVMALGKNYDYPLLGFKLSDKRYSL
jgi:SAM-dependent MidA family methyltransferase